MVCSGFRCKRKIPAFRHPWCKQLIVDVNKIVSTEPQNNEARFEEIKKDVTPYNKNIGYNPAAAPSLSCPSPVGTETTCWDRPPRCTSSRDGLSNEEGKADGKCLLETMDGMLTSTRPTDKPLHLSLKDVNKIGGTGTETGTNKPVIAIVFILVNLATDIQSVEMHQEALPEAVPGLQKSPPRTSERRSTSRWRKDRVAMVGHMQATYDTNTFDSRANRALVIDTPEEAGISSCRVHLLPQAVGNETGDVVSHVSSRKIPFFVKFSPDHSKQHLLVVGTSDFRHALILGFLLLLANTNGLAGASNGGPLLNLDHRGDSTNSNSLPVPMLAEFYKEEQLQAEHSRLASSEGLFRAVK
ncbi:pre-mRNA splicing factor prp17 [Culex quinquefasciatus]|uniref:Pre-mRNA splicing factor prp17 n=1 Tax=Culex quinquefasciatus TaxID=7176 RepID=B0VZ69_CULQU|nr:pre-mRNA splicing factor prp17 [Culex quinquefasciatus]|eukprot:XP_001841683.1 pre-mRNA splicing factor prp17 [Culex quinquefasciatus]